MSTTQEYSSVNNRKSRRRKPRFSESTATKALDRHIFHGVGPKHLGWKFPEYEILDDGSWKPVSSEGPRCWKTPQEELYKWRPLAEHLQGCFRGLVAEDSTHLPFVTVDLDRHSADVLSLVHISEVMATGRLLVSRFFNSLGYRLSWCVEVNPKNGSVKFFGWANRPIPLEVAKKIGEHIHEAMRREGIIGSQECREVFPYNHGQVLLPMRNDKTTIIDTGILAKCVRRKKDRTFDKMVDYETYSVVAFCRWLKSGRHFCQETLERELRTACANLPDKLTRAESPRSAAGVVAQPPPGSGERRKRKQTWQYHNLDADNPNALERQHKALLVFCRRMKRVVTVEEALSFVKDNNLYSGDWEDNRTHRRVRVRWILKRIAKTFDASKCCGVRYSISIGKYDNWARHHVGTIRGTDRRDLDEQGNLVVRPNYRQVDWRFVSVFLAIIEYCLVISPNEDGSLPQVRAEDLWKRCYYGGLTSVKFDERKWAICRDWLEKQCVIKVVDRNWHRGKAMRWAVAKDFNRLHIWWRREKQPGLLEAVSLEDFLKRIEGDTHSLNPYPPQGGQETADVDRLTLLLVRPPP